MVDLDGVVVNMFCLHESAGWDAWFDSALCKTFFQPLIRRRTKYVTVTCAW